MAGQKAREASGVFGVAPGGEGIPVGATAGALQILAELLLLKGDAREAQAQAERALALQLENPSALYFAGLFALRAGDREAAGRYLDSLVGLVPVVRHAMGDLYRDALQAEIALTERRPEEARALFERVVTSGRFILLGYSGVSTPEAVFRDGLARSYLALGEKRKAAEALEALLASRSDFGFNASVRVRAVYRLGVLKLEAGDRARGRELLEKFLEHWGKADWELEEVRDAKERLRNL